MDICKGQISWEDFNTQCIAALTVTHLKEPLSSNTDTPPTLQRDVIHEEEPLKDYHWTLPTLIPEGGMVLFIWNTEFYILVRKWSVTRGLGWQILEHWRVTPRVTRPAVQQEASLPPVLVCPAPFSSVVSSPTESSHFQHHEWNQQQPHWQPLVFLCQ